MISAIASPSKLPRVFRGRWEGDTMIVTIRRRLGIFQTGPILFWFLSYLFINLYIIGFEFPYMDELFQPLQSSPEAGFILGALAWIFLGIFIYVVFLHRHLIREEIKLSDKGIRLRRAVAFVARSRFYLSEKVSDLRMATTADRDYGDAPLFDKNMSALVFDLDMEMVLCGEGLIDDDAREILAEVSIHFPQYVK